MRIPGADVRPFPQSATASTISSVGVPDSLGLLGQWLDLLNANDLAETTTTAYLYGMWKLLRFHRFAVPVLEMSPAHIAAFLASLGLRAPCKEQYAKGIRSFYDWAWRMDYLERSPVALIRPKRAHRPTPVRFEPEELVRLLIAAEWREPRRAWAILACLSLGTRRTEFVNIRASDIDWNRRVVTLRVTKGHRPRDVDLSPWAAEALTELVKLSDSVRVDNPLSRILPVEPNTLNDWVHQAVADAELDGERNGRRRTAHTLRATFVSTLLDEGIPPHVVAALVGHQSLATTSAYAAIGSRRTTAEAVKVFGP